MSRKRIELGAAREAELRRRAARGEASDVIARTVGGISARTARRRKAELRGKSPALAAPPPAPAAENEDDVDPWDVLLDHVFTTPSGLAALAMRGALFDADDGADDSTRRALAMLLLSAASDVVRSDEGGETRGRK